MFFVPFLFVASSYNAAVLTFPFNEYILQFKDESVSINFHNTFKESFFTYAIKGHIPMYFPTFQKFKITNQIGNFELIDSDSGVAVKHKSKLIFKLSREKKVTKLNFDWTYCTKRLT